MRVLRLEGIEKCGGIALGLEIGQHPQDIDGLAIAELVRVDLLRRQAADLQVGRIGHEEGREIELGLGGGEGDHRARSSRAARSGRRPDSRRD